MKTIRVKYTRFFSTLHILRVLDFLLKTKQTGVCSLFVLCRPLFSDRNEVKIYPNARGVESFRTNKINFAQYKEIFLLDFFRKIERVSLKILKNKIVSIGLLQFCWNLRSNALSICTKFQNQFPEFSNNFSLSSVCRLITYFTVCRSIVSEKIFFNDYKELMESNKNILIENLKIFCQNTLCISLSDTLKKQIFNPTSPKSP